MPYLQAVYWDLDGTIANTELEAHLPAFNNSFKDLSLDWHWDKKTYIDLLKINGGKNRISFFAKQNKFLRFPEKNFTPETHCGTPYSTEFFFTLFFIKILSISLTSKNNKFHHPELSSEHTKSVPLIQ